MGCLENRAKIISLIMKIFTDNEYFRILNSRDTIFKAFEYLKGDFGMIISVLDKENFFLGVVTSGDLRRNILNGYSQDTTLIKVLNKNPLVVRIDKKGNKIVEKNDDNNYLKKNKGKSIQKFAAESFGIESFLIPVIDHKNKLIGVTNFNELEATFTEKDYINVVNNPHILIVGGAGYIGSVLSSLLLKKNWRVKVVDNFLYDKHSIEKLIENPNFTIIKKDICDLNVQINAIKDIDSVVFLAEIVGDPSCSLLPQDSIKTNYLAVNSMATLCSYMNINRFVYTSSCSVYGASKDSNSILNENSAINPVSLYARIKSSSEKAILSILNPNFNPTILRLATVFGPSLRQRFDLVVNTFAKNAFSKQKIIVNGGNQWRPNIHVVDVANAIINVLDSPVSKVGKQIFNVCNEAENNTISNIANIVRKVFTDCEIEYLKNYSDLRNYKVSAKKIFDQINFLPQFSIEDGLFELLEYFNKNKHNNFDENKYSNIETHLSNSLDYEFKN